MTTPPDGPTLHPALPVHEPPDMVPPRSRVPAHVIGTLTGLVVAPLAVGALLVGAGGLVGRPDGTIHGEGLFLLGAVLFALWSILAGALSSLTMAVPALVWFVVLPLLTGPTMYGLATVAPAGLGDEVHWALDLLVVGHWWVLLAVLLLGCAVAIHEARRSGRRTERAEAALVAAPATPPPSRMAAHVGATAAATVLAVVAAWLTSLQGPGVTPALVGTAVGLGIAAALGGVSALAPFVAGATGLLLQVVVLAGLLGDGGSQPAPHQIVSVALDAGNGLAAWVMLLISFLGPWQARRVGRVLERAEIALIP